jgi:hypothetical protein
LAFLGRLLGYAVTAVCGRIIARTHLRSQGWYSDNAAAKRAHFLVPAWRGSRIVFRGELPWRLAIRRQTLAVYLNGRETARFRFGRGPFEFEVTTPAEWDGQVLLLELVASRAYLTSL